MIPLKDDNPSRSISFVNLLLGLWIGLQIASGITELSGTAGGVAWFAHIGGFAAGLILAIILKPKRRK